MGDFESMLGDCETDLERLEAAHTDLQVERDDLYVQACKLDRVAQRAEDLLRLMFRSSDDPKVTEACVALREAVQTAYCCDNCKQKIRPTTPTTTAPDDGRQEAGE